jgi:Mg-chelatase subunit ChlD
VLAGQTAMRKRVLVITDSAKPESSYGAIVERLVAREISVSAVGVQSFSRSGIHSIADRGRGRAYMIEDLAGLRRILVAEVQAKGRFGPIAVAFVIDRSASMAGPPLAAATEAARAGIEMLGPDDVVTVIAFDTTAHTVTSVQRASNKMRISADVSRIQAGGLTTLRAGLEEARDALAGVNARAKLVFLITDGGGSDDGLADLGKQLADQHVMIVTIGLPGAKQALLQLSSGPAGRLYMTELADLAPRMQKLLVEVAAAK